MKTLAQRMRSEVLRTRFDPEKSVREKLTDDELNMLSNDQQKTYHRIWDKIGWQSPWNDTEWVQRDTIIEWLTELALVRMPMPCGHPRGCIVTSSYIEGVGTSNHCGWCEEEVTHGHTEAERDALRKQLAAAEQKNLRLENELRCARRAELKRALKKAEECQ